MFDKTESRGNWTLPPHPVNTQYGVKAWRTACMQEFMPSTRVKGDLIMCTNGKRRRGNAGTQSAALKPHHQYTFCSTNFLLRQDSLLPP